MNVADILSVNGRIPRRAVLVDGRLADKTQFPHEQEIDVVSKLCEIASGEKAYPRHTSALMDIALTTNDPDAWSAACDDLTTGDFDIGSFIAVLSQNHSNVASFATCLATARDARHLMHIVRIFHTSSSHLTDDIREVFGRTLGCQLRSLVDVLAVHGGFLKKDVRDAVTSELGKVLVTVPEHQLAEIMHTVVMQKKYDALRLFMHTPGCFRSKPDAISHLIDRAPSVPIQHRVSVMSVLASITTYDAKLVNVQALRTSLTAMLGDTDVMTDVRVVLSLAMLSKVAFEDEVAKGLASALERAASHILSKV